MPIINPLNTFSPGTDILSAEVNANFNAIRNAFNASAVLTDVARTVAARHTLAAGVDVTGGGVGVAGGGVQVSDGNVEVTSGVVKAQLGDDEAQLQGNGVGTNTLSEFGIFTNQVNRIRVLTDGSILIGTDPGGGALFRASGGAHVANGLEVSGSATLNNNLKVTGASELAGATVTRAGVVTANAVGNTGAAKTIDWSLSNTARITVDQNTTPTFAGAATDQWCSLRIRWGGAFNITWPADVRWPGGVAPSFTRIAGRVDWVSFFFNGAEYEALPGAFNIASSV